MIHRMLLASLFVLSLAAPSVAAAGPAPAMDPKAMSGIGRPDTQVPAGSLTVRVLGPGGFADPRVGVEVELTLTGSGGASEKRVGVTADEGRVTFDGLEPFFGGQAIAAVTLGGEQVASAPIPVLASTGSRVMLVEGAATPPTRPTASPESPLPGEAFPLPSTPVGTLTVGAFDLGTRRGLPGIEVRLVGTSEGGATVERTALTDALGKAVFEGLTASEIPAGVKWVAEATLVPGEEPRRSTPFELPRDSGAALVLASGEAAAAAASTADPAPRRTLLAPRILATLEPGVIQVTVIGGRDEPVANQQVVVEKQSSVGIDGRWEGRTDDRGIAILKDLPRQQDAVYFVTVPYGGAPYRSPMFLMEEKGGVAVDLRVFETTADRTLVRSALQFDLEERENDLLQVVQVYEALVTGDRAFWDPNFQLTAVPGAKGLTVLRPAEDWLEHVEKAPFVTLSGPLPPGERVNLSLGYLVEHDGAFDLRWSPPFSTVETSIIVDDHLPFEASGAQKTALKSPVPGKAVYSLGPTSIGATVQFHVDDLRVSNRLFRRLAAWIGGLMVLSVLGAIAFRPRVTAEQRLQARKQELLALLERDAPRLDEAERKRLLLALDRVHRQLRALGRIEARGATR